MLMNEGLVRDMAKAMQDRACFGKAPKARNPQSPDMETEPGGFGPWGSEPSVSSGGLGYRILVVAASADSPGAYYALQLERLHNGRLYNVVVLLRVCRRTVLSHLCSAVLPKIPLTPNPIYPKR